MMGMLNSIIITLCYICRMYNVYTYIYTCRTAAMQESSEEAHTRQELQNAPAESKNV